MSSIEQSIKEILGANSVVLGLVADRIYPGVAGQGTALPFLEYSLLRSESEQTMKDAAGLFGDAIRFDAWGESPEVVESITRATRNALNAFSGVQSGIRIDGVFYQDQAGPFFDPDTRFFRRSLDLVFYHN